MNEYPPCQTDRFWEDSYTAEFHTTFDELKEFGESWWLSEWPGSLNWPIWITYDEDNESEWKCGPTIIVGVVMPRHGNVCQHISPATPEQVKEMEVVLLRAWGRRADIGFRRHGSQLVRGDSYDQTDRS